LAGGGNEVGAQKCKKTKVKKVSSAQTEEADQLSGLQNQAAAVAVAGSTEVRVGKIQVFVNLGWYKLDENISKVAQDGSGKWFVDSATGSFTTDYSGSIHLNNSLLEGVRGIASLGGKWKITEEGLIVAEEIQVKRAKVEETLQVGTENRPSGVTLFDSVTGAPYCLQIANGQMVSTAGACAPIERNKNTNTTTEGNTGNADTSAGTDNTSTSTVNQGGVTEETNNSDQNNSVNTETENTSEGSTGEVESVTVENTITQNESVTEESVGTPTQDVSPEGTL
jgi:hypothetical protein